ncbi:MAG: hypothetical protein A3F35_00815 [Candidatus Woykebacteria bacterium RIFCSPHIGHO2_12_FULL_45_10]|uniref:RNase H type-1 domain-containing protein n=1 Tax=Candidatus Woykebacteria bacterium RIFCSPHIGHO2_12_FULL_45_10 TaxID=1802603 RepID=A0A1G1WRV0_9BACT|nr:MAG: hypothetical protein A3F35_00815 [Candidatus Woykebacteria bacterium RIFCSPHIGHO2_12_FULL_45_10]
MIDQKIYIHADGGARGNPGVAAAGIFLDYPAEKVRLLCGKYLGMATNNFAEYQGVLLGLEKAAELVKGGAEAVFFLDSSLVVNQLNGLFKIKSALLGELNLKVREKEKLFTRVSYTHIPREQNTQADSVVNRTLDAKKDFSQFI